MYKFSKYLSVILLIAFAWVITPIHSIHDIFADHEDTADNYCLLNHSHLGVHVESKHTHCDELDFTGAVFFKTDFVTIKGLVTVISSAVNELNPQQVISYLGANLPSRAPPALA